MPGDLHYGDNLSVLRNKVASESIDLIYLDPPFNSDRSYNLIHQGAIISVKGGKNINPDFVKALKTTVDQEGVDYGVLITMHPPSPKMKEVARECGKVQTDDKPEHKIRIVTIPEILAGTVRLPGKNVTPRTASVPPPPEARVGETLNLPFPAKSIASAKPRRSGPGEKKTSALPSASTAPKRQKQRRRSRRRAPAR